MRYEVCAGDLNPNSADRTPRTAHRLCNSKLHKGVLARMMEMATEGLICPRCGAGIPVPARFCPACGHAAARLLPGETLDGKYEILEKIAEGGMGEVYKARHLHLDEVRIIKVTKPDALGEGRDPRRFQEEARMATLVRHPNVAALYDFSRLPDGSYYMVWEFIDGVTLEEWMRRHGPLPAAQALDIARQVLAGLSEIHAQGIVHRDLSPDNILVRADRDGRLLAKIIDLGIAKRIAAESQSMTGTGLFVGKLKYCSPEQAGALPAGESLDGRSDLYSFGVVLYEMLAGKPPFEAETPEAYLGKHLHTPAPPLETSRLPSGPGQALSAIVLRALAKQRGRRYSSAGEFAEALERIRPAIATMAEQDGATVASGARARGHSFGLVLSVGVALAVAAAFWILNRPGSARTSEAVPAFAAPETPSPAPAPTAGPDQIVVAPRIVELRSTAAMPTPRKEPPAPAPTPGPEPSRLPSGAPMPASSSAPAPASGEMADAPIEGVLTEAKLRNFIRVWKTRPIERRARRSLEVASIANFWAASHPGDAFTEELKQTLPQALRAATEEALENGKPGLARLFHNAYRQFRFSSPDPELARRVRQAPR